MRYRTIAREVVAQQFRRPGPLPEGCYVDDHDLVLVRTAGGGALVVRDGDWVVTEADGMRRVVPERAFQAYLAPLE